MEQTGTHTSFFTESVYARGWSEGPYHDLQRAIGGLVKGVGDELEPISYHIICTKRVLCVQSFREDERRFVHSFFVLAMEQKGSYSVLSSSLFSFPAMITRILPLVKAVGDNLCHLFFARGFYDISKPLPPPHVRTHTLVTSFDMPRIFQGSVLEGQAPHHRPSCRDCSSPQHHFPCYIHWSWANST